MAFSDKITHPPTEDRGLEVLLCLCSRGASFPAQLWEVWRIWIRMAMHNFVKPDPHQRDKGYGSDQSEKTRSGFASERKTGSWSASKSKPDPDPLQVKSLLRIRIKVKTGIRIRIKVARNGNTVSLHNTDDFLSSSSKLFAEHPRVHYRLSVFSFFSISLAPRRPYKLGIVPNWVSVMIRVSETWSAGLFGHCRAKTISQYAVTSSLYT